MKKSLIILLACALAMGIALPAFLQDLELPETAYLPFVVTDVIEPTATSSPSPQPTLTSTATALPTSTDTATPEPSSTLVPEPTDTQTPTATPTVITGLFQLSYEINRAGLPDVSFNMQTVNVQVGAVSQLLVQVDGQTVSHSYNPATGLVSFNTEGSQIEVFADVQNGDSQFGEAQIATFRDNKRWAYSHGFDDNVEIREGMLEFENYGWTGTIFAIAEIIDDNRNESWIEDKIDIINHLNNNWSLGSHGFDTSCQDYQEENIVNAFNRLAGIVAESERSDYLLTSFAAPCFVSEYHPLILNMRNSGKTDVLFNESGNSYILGFENGEALNIDNYTVSPFNFDEPVGRGLVLESDSGTQAKLAFDWVSAYASSDQPVWINTLTHGNKEAVIADALSHLYNNYGPGGSDEVWVAPSDEIYAYQIIRLQGGLTSAGISPISSFPAN